MLAMGSACDEALMIAVTVGFIKDLDLEELDEFARQLEALPDMPAVA